jgi:DNA modification methylase
MGGAEMCRFYFITSPKGKLMTIKFDARNYRKHNDKNKELINKSLTECGAGRSILIDNDDEIIAGNGVFEQAKALNIPVKIIETDGNELIAVKRTDLSTDDEKRKRLAIMDNSTSDTSEFDIELLQSDFEVPDLQEMGIDIPDIEVEQKEVVEDEVPEDVETRCKRGDIWKLGEHRLMCGDSTKVDDVEKLMNGEKADMVFTDPPYGMGLDTDYSKMPSTKAEGNKHYKKVLGDNEDFKPELITNVLKCFDYCKELFMFGADYFAELLPNKNDGSWIVWDKRVEENFDNMFGSAFELCWSKNKHKREIIRCNNTLFSGEQDAKNKVHPTQKPLKVVQWFLDRYSKDNQSIVDLYGGSGSTLISCEQLNRKCFIMELDEHYCDVIIQRWENLTGKTATLVNGVA